MNKNRKLIYLLSAIGALLLIVLIIAFWPSEGRRIRQENEQTLEGFKELNLTEEQRDTVMTELGEARVMKKKDLISDVQLDKVKVCPGEAIRVRMIQNSDEVAPVSFNVNRKRGNPAYIRFKAPGKRDVFVTASDGQYGLDLAKKEVEVLDKDSPECVNKAILVVDSSLSKNETESADIEVTQVTGMAGKVRFIYEFGDGKKEESPEKFQRHNYGLRDQNKPESTFLIGVTAIDEKGNQVVGNTSISLPNGHFLAKITGNPVVPVVYNRFPTKKGSAYETELTFKNIEKTPLRFDKAELTMEYCQDKKESKKTEMAASRLLGDASLPAGGISVKKLSLPTSTTGEDACRVQIVFVGDMPGSKDPLTSTLFLELNPPPLGGGEAGAVRVADQKMIDKLNKARQILGNDKPITPADIQRLEKQGKL